MPTVPISLTGGVVRSRGEGALSVGEWWTAKNVMFERSDTRQLNRDFGRTKISSAVTLVGLFYLNFESGSSKLVRVRNDGTDTFIDYTEANIRSVSWTNARTITGSVATASDISHRGGTYYLGTDIGNYVITQPSGTFTIRPLGMDRISGTGNDWPEPFGTSSSMMNTSTATGTSNWVTRDIAVYALVEYSSSLNLESAPTALCYDEPAGNITGDSEAFRILWGGVTTYTRRNDGTGETNVADKIRIYRHYFGTAGHATASRENEEAERMRGPTSGLTAPEIAFVGGLVKEVDFSDDEYTDEGHVGDRNDPVPAFPIVYEDTGGTISIWERHRRPSNFTMSAIFHECLIANDPDTSKQVLRYSPPKELEYQPAPYFMYFATDRSDEIVGFTVIENRLIVLTSGSIHRVNWLQFERRIGSGQGRSQEVVAYREGCVGREAWTKVETPQGEFVVWLSRQGLRATRGGGWIDACPDWTVEGAGLSDLSNCVLENDVANYRIRLFTPQGKIWDFYYHQSLTKGNAFRCLGPHDYVDTSGARFSTIGPIADDEIVWTADSSGNVYAEGQGRVDGYSEFVSGVLNLPLMGLRRSNPLQRVQIQGMGLTHGRLGSSHLLMKTEAGFENENMSWEERRIPRQGEPGDRDLDWIGTSYSRLNETGTRFRFTYKISDGETYEKFGPAWVNMDVTQGRKGR